MIKVHKAQRRTPLKQYNVAIIYAMQIWILDSWRFPSAICTFKQRVLIINWLSRRDCDHISQMPLHFNSRALNFLPVSVLTKLRSRKSVSPPNTWNFEDTFLSRALCTSLTNGVTRPPETQKAESSNDNEGSVMKLRSYLWHNTFIHQAHPSIVPTCGDVLKMTIWKISSAGGLILQLPTAQAGSHNV